VRLTRALATAAAGGGVGVLTYAGLVTGRLTLDVGVGRRTRPLGPLVVDVAAPRDVVYAVASAPYAERRPRAMQEKVQILERGDGMVLAAHRTPLGAGLVAVTVETVTFQPPARIGFRLLRGPVPHVSETFELTEIAEGTRLTYTGELATDFARAGEAWGALVARTWVATVTESRKTIRSESERRADLGLVGEES
jgi:hypothetical protein